MAHVTGIGGLFFRSENPAALSKWYADHLGIGTDPLTLWRQEAGPTILAPFSRDTTYFGRPEQSFLLNLRTDDLEGLLAKLAKAGIAAETRDEWNSHETGRFARIHDPEGNPIELWEPAANLR